MELRNVGRTISAADGTVEAEYTADHYIYATQLNQTVCRRSSSMQCACSWHSRQD